MILTLFEYRIPFSRPFVTSGMTYRERKGLIIELQKEGITAWGEAAPLPGFSAESVRDIKRFLATRHNALHQLFSGDIEPGETEAFFNRVTCPPSFQFAIDTLICDYYSQQEQLSIQHVLFRDPRDFVEVNSVVSLTGDEEIDKKVSRLNDEGFRTVKFKIGRNFTEELSKLRTIRSRFPELTIRLDANRGWTSGEAANNLEALAELKPEYCEEPIHSPTPEKLDKLCHRVPVPIALDETLAEDTDIRSLAETVQVLILKPMVLGSFSKLFATKGVGDTHNNKVVITTSLECGVGRMMTAILASGLGTPETAHGLATGKTLKMDVWHDGTYINNGCFYLPGAPGLGKKNRSNLQSVVIDKLEL